MTTPSKSTISFPEYFGQAVTLYAENFQVLLNFSFAASALTIFKALLDATDESGVSFIGLLLTPLVFAAYTFFSMCLIYMTASLATGHALTAGEAVKYVRTKCLKGMGGYLLLSLAVIAGLVLLLLPGIYCFTVFYFFIFPILLEDMGVMAAFKRCQEFVRPRFWKVLAAHGLVFLLMVILILPLVIGTRMMGFGGGVMPVLIGVVTSLVMPVFVGFYYFIYMALKAEHDGRMNIAVHA